MTTETEPAVEGALLMREVRDHAAIAEVLREKVNSLTSPRKKHARLQAAILSSVSEASLLPGDQLPPEPELARATGMSLGTVRRCLTRMAAEGLKFRNFYAGCTVCASSRSVLMTGQRSSQRTPMTRSRPSPNGSMSIAPGT